MSTDNRNVTFAHPAEVVDLRREQAQWWDISDDLRYALAVHNRRGVMDERLAAEEVLRWLRRNLRAAELYWVSPDMTDFIATVALDLPDVVPLPPLETGFVVFAKPVYGTDAEDGKVIATSAYLWAPTFIVETWCVSLVTFTHPSLLKMMTDEIRPHVPAHLFFTGDSQWEFGKPWSDPVVGGMKAKHDTEIASEIEDRRLLATFWAMLSQRITIETEERGDRAVNRRAQRANMPTKPVRVINLRETTINRIPGEHADIEWSHRWVVGKHWRNQWYARENVHKPILIEPYVKGPSDKPLLVRETVRALKR